MVQRQVSFEEAVKRGFANYCCFTGRSSRSEYWWWALFTTILGIAVTVVFSIIAAIAHSAAILTVGTFVSYAISLGLFLPGLGLAVRRLHDTGRSGWFILLSLIPLVGAIILIVWFCQASTPVANQYGEVPNME